MTQNTPTTQTRTPTVFLPSKIILRPLASLGDTPRIARPNAEDAKHSPTSVTTSTTPRPSKPSQPRKGRGYGLAAFEARRAYAADPEVRLGIAARAAKRQADNAVRRERARAKAEAAREARETQGPAPAQG